MKEDVKNLNLDEMNQVAGGTWGVGFGACNTGGIGVGGSGDFVCAVIGAGSGAGVCFVKGASIDDK